jgi:aspartyl-tRNA(Asn)/glutamyl-tRNA(Gln) amidotransferase subunit C
MERATHDDVAHVAKLAHLAVPEEELERLRRELNRILEHFAELQKLNTDDVEPMSHAVPMDNVFREDKVQESLPLDAILQNAPDPADEFFRVPRIVED